MITETITFFILVYATCIAGMIFGLISMLKTRKALIGCLSYGLIIICFIFCYIAVYGFFDELQTQGYNFKLAVGGEGYKNKISLFFINLLRY